MNKPTFNSLVNGSRIRITDDNNFVCTATVVAVSEGSNLRVKDVIDQADGRKEHFADFDLDEIVQLEVLDEAKETASKVEKDFLDKERFEIRAPVIRKKQQCQRRPDYRSNPHLSGLGPICMDDLVHQRFSGANEPLPVLDLERGQPKVLQTPVQVTHRDQLDELLKHSRTFDQIFKMTWNTSKSCPMKLESCPELVHIITDMNSEAMDIAKEKLGQAKVIGVSMEGQCLGRNGTLSLLLLSTNTLVFVFDIIALKTDIIRDIIAPLFESNEVTKVFCDVRQASDLVFHQFGIKLTNVQDLQAIHGVTSTWAIYHGFRPHNKASYNQLALMYLGIHPEQLFNPIYRQSFLSTDTGQWLQRPLPNQLEVGAIKNVILMLDLHRVMTKMAMTPIVLATEVLLSDLRDAPAKAIEKKELHHLPPGFSEVLPNWVPNPGAARQYGHLNHETRSVHLRSVKLHPNINFSRDISHIRRN